MILSWLNHAQNTSLEAILSNVGEGQENMKVTNMVCAVKQMGTDWYVWEPRGGSNRTTMFPIICTELYSLSFLSPTQNLGAEVCILHKGKNWSQRRHLSKVIQPMNSSRGKILLAWALPASPQTAGHLGKAGKSPLRTQGSGPLLMACSSIFTGYGKLLLSGLWPSLFTVHHADPESWEIHWEAWCEEWEVNSLGCPCILQNLRWWDDERIPKAAYSHKSQEKNQNDHIILALERVNEKVLINLAWQRRPKPKPEVRKVQKQAGLYPGSTVTPRNWGHWCLWKWGYRQGWKLKYLCSVYIRSR